MIIHPRFLFEEIRHGGKQALTFVICVALSIATLTALNSFKRDVHTSLIEEARALQGGDIIIHAHRPISAELQQAVTNLAGEGLFEQQKSTSFYTVALAEKTQRSLFVNIKAVEPGYPFYGTVSLGSGRQLGEALEPGAVVAAREVLERLDIEPGDLLSIGDIDFTVADTITYESMKPVSFLSLGPRVFVAMADVDRLGLVGKGSRTEHEILIKVADAENIEMIEKQLNSSAVPRLERVETARDSRSRVKVFFDNLLFFLSCISILTLILSGIGMQGSLSAILRQKQRVIAVTKAFGASNRFLVTQYLLMVSLMGFLGSVAGVISGYGIKRLFPFIFADLLPESIGYRFHIADTLEGIILGILVVTVFTLLPLQRLGSVKPVMIFRHETETHARRNSILIAASVFVIFLFLLVVRQIDDVKIGIFFVIGILVLIGGVTLVTSAALWLLKRLHLPLLSLRQAAKSLYRPGNSTRPIVTTLTSATAVLLVIFLLRLNLFATFIESYPDDAPNLFCIDIQKDQVDLFQSVVGKEIPLFPVIRARLLAINDERIDPEEERERRSDNLGREFNLTYRETLLDDELVIDGDSLFGDSNRPDGTVAVSVLDSIAEIGDIGLNDRLRFNIQGIEIDAQVTSIRSRTQSRLYPFFYFVFEPETLQDAPQTFFTAFYMDKELIPDMITRIIAEMPNISALNVADIAERFGRIMKRLALIVTFFASFSIAAGFLILVSTIFSTRLDRIRESVYYKILGADSGFIVKVLSFEHLIIGLLSSLLAVAFAQLAAWLICINVFEIDYRPYWSLALITLICSVCLVVGVGLVSSVAVIRQKPGDYLRQQNGG